MAGFTDRAVFWMNEFKNNPGGDRHAARPVLAGVGSDWMRANQNNGKVFPTAAKYREFLTTHHVTDCITYATDVMKYAYQDSGSDNLARMVKQSPYSLDGVKLANYLVDTQHWKGYYWNPDAELSFDRKYFDESPDLSIGYYCHYNISPIGDPPPAGSDEARFYRKVYEQKFIPLPKAKRDAVFEAVKRYVNEHSYTADQAVRLHGYYGVRVTDVITGWNPTTRAETTFKVFNGHPNDRPNEPTFPSENARTRARNRLAEFNKVRFGFGLARGGRHTYLFTLGKVYEAHWDAGPADTTNQNADPLYQVRTLPAWSAEAGWQSGLVVVPPDGALSFFLPAA